MFSSAVTFRFLIVFWRFSTTTAGPDIGLSRNELSICTITSIMFFLFVLDLVQNDIRQAFTRLCEIIDVESFFISSYILYLSLYFYSMVLFLFVRVRQSHSQ